jgi:hypothetical protein
MAQVHIELSNLPVTSSELTRMREDLHLVKAAVRTDNILLSLDDEARKLFAAAVVAIPSIGSLMWNNPKEEVNPALWIEKGAPTQESRTLRNYTAGTA